MTSRLRYFRFIFAVAAMFVGSGLIAPAMAQDDPPGGGAWCQWCEPPGVCRSTASGEIGATNCVGLGGNQCQISGQWCMWEVETFRAGAQTMVFADGSTVEVSPLLPGVFVATSCAKGGAQTFVPQRDGTIAAFDGARRVDLRQSVALAIR